MGLKLPHWAQVVLACAALVISYLIHQQSAGQLDLPAALVAGLTVANTILGLVTQAAFGSASAPSKPAGFVSLNALLLCLAAGLAGCMGCAWLKSNPQVVSSVSDIAACVLSHDTEQPAQIAVECGGITVADVLKILSAEQAAKARALCPAPVADAGPGK